MWSRLDGANRSTPDTVTSLMLKLIRVNKQLPHARLHDLRHLHATTLLLSGVPVHVVATRLGHADPAIYPPRLRTRDPLSRGRRRGHFR
jgi:integrase